MINPVRTEFEASLAGARVDALRELTKNGHRLTVREQVELDTMVSRLEDYRTMGWREARDVVAQCNAGFEIGEEKCVPLWCQRVLAGKPAIARIAVDLGEERL